MIESVFTVMNIESHGRWIKIDHISHKKKTRQLPMLRYACYLIIVGVNLACWSPTSQGKIEFYVATNGDDFNIGTKEKPFKSLESARQAVREIRQNGSLDKPATIWIRGGTYYRTKTFALTKQDSGMEQVPIEYRAYGKEEVRFVGGKEIKVSWFEPVKEQAILERLQKRVGKKALEVDLKIHGITDFGELGSLTGGLKLFFNGQRLPLARWPNKGWALACSTKVIGLDESEAEQLAKEGKLGNKLVFKFSGEPPNRWWRMDGIWLRGYWQQEYVFEGINPREYNSDKREITLGWRAWPHLNTWRRFYAANVLEELDHPGEWYLDRKTGILYLLPPEDFKQGELIASLLQEPMVVLDNTSNVSIRGLTLETMRGVSVVVNGGEHNRIAGCVIRNAGQGVILSGGMHNGVTGCNIYDLDSMGIRMSGGDRKTLRPAGLYALNNHIHHYAKLLKTWHPGIKIDGVGNRAAHNLIHDAPQYAISYQGNDHIIEFNNLHHVCLEMSDVGVIGSGTDWTFRGNVVRYNFIHHIPERPYPGVIGVYLDNCVSSTEIFGNVFYDVPKAVMIGGGRDNIVANNIFIQCKVPVYLDNRGLRWNHFQPDGPMYEPLKQFRITEPPWSTRYPKLARILDECPQAPLGNVLARNLSYRSGWCDPEQVCRATFKQNIDKKYMRIEDNLVTDKDPGYVDEANMNFQLRDDSIVFRKIPGFKKIPFNKIGLYKDKYRVTLPGATSQF